MLRKIMVLVAGLFMTAASAQDFETATQAVMNMKIGWNLGNTLEAYNNNGVHQGLESETYWGAPYVTEPLFTMMRNAGFGAIRVPVTWMNHMDSSGKVDAEWMARVKTIVDWVLKNDMYCILNVHHDTGSNADSNCHWLVAQTSIYNNVKSRYEYLWQQIAEEFKDYGQKLLFEAYNEMLDQYNSWCYASMNASGRYNETSATDSYNAINQYAQCFVTTVRNTGGNNAKRNLVVTTYGACSGSGIWSDYLKDPLINLSYPTDPAGSGHIVFEVHSYPSIVNTDMNNNITGNRPMTDVKEELDDMVNAIKTYLVNKGAPVIIGEWGTSNVDATETDYIARRTHMLDFVELFVKTMMANDIGTFYWMGLSELSNRSLPAFNQADLAQRMMQAYYGTTEGLSFPDATSLEKEYLVNYTQQWGELNLVNRNLSIDDYSGIRVELADATHYGKLKIKCYGTGGNYQYDDVASNSTMTKVTFLEGTLGGKSISRVTLQNATSGSYSAKVKKVVLLKKDGTEETVEPTVAWNCAMEIIVLSTDISLPTSGPQPSDKEQIFDLHGRRLNTKPNKGFYISNGRKVVIN